MKHEEYQRKIDAWLENEKFEKKKLINELNEKKKEMMMEVERKIGFIQDEINNEFEKRENEIKDFDKNDNFLKSDELKYEIVFKDRTILCYNETIIESGLEVQDRESPRNFPKKTSNPISSTHKCSHFPPCCFIVNKI